MANDLLVFCEVVQ